MASREKFTHVSRKVESYCDPYLMDIPPDEVAICRECRSVYAAGVWKLESQAEKDVENAKRVTDTLCPACKKTRDRMPGGVVTLTGRFLDEHEQEIVSLMNNENERAMNVNPLERIIDIEKRGSEITVLTTNEKLAQRIGRAVHKAYDGDVEYKWSKGTKLARVTWHRD
jgi:NMD protein affecting ribosome stability and mRNA decay